MAIPTLSIECPACGAEMVIFESTRQDGDGNPLALDLYRCPTDGCGRKFVGIFEPEGGLTAEQGTWVEREVMRLGAFFPQDYSGPRGRRG